MGNTTIQTLKGFRDFIGTEAKKRQWLTEKVKGIFEMYGFEPLETPALEYDELLSGKYGDEAEKLIYRFEDRGNRKVALRYDQTVPTARVISQYQNILTFPYRRYQIQPVWRADKPQRGRFREFLQCDADIIGTTSDIADAEILTLFWNIFRTIGLDSLVIKMNDRGKVFQAIIEAGIPENKVMSVVQIIDKLDKKDEREVVEEFSAQGIDTAEAEKILHLIRQLQPPERIKSIIDKAIKLGIPEDRLVFTPALVRGLDYYTGLVFEGSIPEYEGVSVGGGGRYDTLIQKLVGLDYPAVGFGLGFDRTLEAAELLGKIPQCTLSADVFVTIFSEELTDISLQTASFLREHDISSEISCKEIGKMDKQLRYAHRKNIPYVIIIGPDEERQNKMILKDMTSGAQNLLTKEEVIQRITPHTSKTILE